MLLLSKILSQKNKQLLLILELCLLVIIIPWQLQATVPVALQSLH